MNLILERLARLFSAGRDWVLPAHDNRASPSYKEAYEAWKNRDRDLGVSLDASQRFTRDQAHER
jgi:hypothetical protein